MTPTADLMKLVEKWPLDRHPDPHTDAWTLGYIRAKRECADELQAALTASCDARVGGEVPRYSVTTGHCTQKSAGSRDCGLHNLHCNWPKCDQRVELLNPTPYPATPAQPKASEDFQRAPNRPSKYPPPATPDTFGSATTPKASEGKAGGEDARDAARYRWLRSQVRWQLPNQRDSWTTPSGVYLVATMVSKVYGDCAEQTDAAIDAAMTATLIAPGADDGL